MSFLVELPRARYPRDVFDAFKPVSDFSLANAYAMMWMSQLAYETDNRGTVEDVLKSWELDLKVLIANAEGSLPSMRTACGLVAAGRGATIVALAGTDPLKLNDWITDLKALPSSDGIHSGFQDALEEIWSRIAATVEDPALAQNALILTGHSLGAALAVVAAERARPKIQAKAVYAFGCPRVGGKAFADAYTPALGGNTYRLVHGTDWVPTVPLAIGYRHVGRFLRCGSEGRFGLQPALSAPDNNEPHTTGNISLGLLEGMGAFVARRVFSFKSSWLESALELLPLPVRDHLPTKYLKALGS